MRIEPCSCSLAAKPAGTVSMCDVGTRTHLASATESGHSMLEIRRSATNSGNVAKYCKVLNRNDQHFPSAGALEVVHAYSGANIQSSS